MVEQADVIRMQFTPKRSVVSEKYPWVRSLPYKAQQAATEAAHYKEEGGYRLMAVRPLVFADGILSQFMGLPMRVIKLWGHQQEVILFVNEEQRAHFLKAFPETTAI